MARTVRSEFRPLPPQQAFLRSKAKIRGYGGAMGGGKSRTLCEDAFTQMLDRPGLKVVIARAQHTSIIETTKKTMLEQVIPADLIDGSKASQGEDYIRLWNGSVCHFIGLDDPLRWYSSEIGYMVFDEAQEIELEKAIRLITRLRQQGAPNRATFGFNPSNPGHWLQRWFYLGGARTQHGFYKQDLYASDDATVAIGDCEFVFAKATDNTYLPEGYVEQTLAGLPDALKRRYLDGEWEYITGNAFFDKDALRYYTDLAHETQPVANGVLDGDIQQDINYRIKRVPPKDKIRIRKLAGGPLAVYKPPVRAGRDKGQKEHRYVIGVDSSSGRGEDWTAMQVIDVDSFEQAAELQVKATPFEAAEWAYRLGRIYNDALVVCEVTGGWGFAVDQRLRELRYPRPYTRRVIDRLSKRFTDRLGFDTNKATRPLILSSLEEAIRERSLGIYSLRTVAELGSFVWSDKEKAEAQPGAHDDLVMALALAVYVAGTLPKELRRPVVQRHEPQFSATGY